MASSYVPALSPPLMSSSGLRTTKGDVRIHLHARRAEGGGGVRRGAEGADERLEGEARLLARSAR